MKELDRITFEPGKLGGKACIRGMRISVSFVLRMLASGMPTQQILREHPDLEPADIDQCLEYAAILAEERVHPHPAVAS
jgi:uncharacterized protein (DUF433 family)